VDFFGIGFMEILLIVIVGLILLGPGKMVEYAKTLGRLSRNLKKMSSDFTTTVDREMNLNDENEGKSHLKPKNEISTNPPSMPASTGQVKDPENQEPAAHT
jgi:sec-independent protein translocase protein TatB